MSASASLHCQHCGQPHVYEGRDLHVALIPGGPNDSTQLLWFTCQMCGDFNSLTVGEDFAMGLGEIGARTTVVGPIPELDETVRRRVDPISESVVRMLESMSVGSFNAVLVRQFRF